MKPPEDSPDATADEPGDLLAGRYRVRAVLGSGAFGEVLRVEDERLGREVALKLLRGAAGSEGGNEERFRREARAAIGISHPHLVPLLDMGEVEDGRPFLVFELVPGGDLASWLEENGPGSPERIRDWTRGLGEALATLHASGVLHRDVKPANVLLHEDGRAMLADLGLARVSGQETLTATGQVLGTMAYLAPEVLAGHLPGPEADLYALGCTAFEAWSDELWFRREGRGEDALSSLPASLEWMRELLADDPGARAAGLARLRARPPVVEEGAPRSSASAPGREPPGARGRSTARWIGAGLAIAVAGGWALDARESPPPSPPEEASPASAEVLDLGLSTLVERMPRMLPGNRFQRISPYMDPALTLRTRRYLAALGEVSPEQARAASGEWLEAGYLYLVRLHNELDEIDGALGDAMVLFEKRSILPEGGVEPYQAFRRDFDAQRDVLAARAREAGRWGTAPLLDLVHLVLVRHRGARVDPSLLASLARGLEEAEVGVELELFLAEAAQALLQGKQGTHVGDTEVRQRVVEAMLQRIQRDLRGQGIGPAFRKAMRWPLRNYLDAAFLARQGQVVTAALEGAHLSPTPPALEGHLRLLLKRGLGSPQDQLLARFLERWYWNCSMLMAADSPHPGARLIGLRQRALEEHLGGDVWGIRWKRE